MTGKKTRKKKTAHNARQQTEAEANRKAVAEMYLKSGRTQADIAEELGLAQSTVSGYLKTLRERWAESAQHELAEHKAAQLARLEHLLGIYHTKLEKSTNEEYITRYLEGIRKVIKDITALLGLEKIKVDLGVDGDSLNRIVEFFGLEVDDGDGESTPQG